MSVIGMFSKVYIVMRLGKILGLSELDYDAQLIHSIPKSYRESIQLLFAYFLTELNLYCQ